MKDPRFSIINLPIKLKILLKASLKLSILSEYSKGISTPSIYYNKVTEGIPLYALVSMIGT